MGAFTWTPNETQAPGVYKITVIAVADDSPLLSSCRTFAATVKGTPLRFTSFLLDSDSIFRARLTAIDGTNYTFQASTNWRDWTSLLTSNAVNGSLDFSDTNASGFLFRFYRVLIGP